VRPLLPCVIADHRVTAINDALGLMPLIVRTLLERSDLAGNSVLVQAAHGYLGGSGLFSDPEAADAAMGFAREYLDRLVSDLRERGCLPVAVDGEQVLFGASPDWSDTVAQQVAEAARAYLPPAVTLKYLGEYAAVYARARGTVITLGRDGSVTLVGPSFRAGRLERFGEGFMQRAAPHALLGDAVRLRQAFLEMVHLLRSAQVSLEDLCVQVTLHKSPAQYRRGGTHEEPYEVLLGAGVRAWRVGQRIRYFRVRGGEARLLQEGDGASAADADAEYYVQRLVGLYCQQLAQAFRREDFARIFRLPSGVGPFEDGPEVLAELATIRPIAEPVQ
jgi:DNA polymerase elongation subunit (family B)